MNKEIAYKYEKETNKDSITVYKAVDSNGKPYDKIAMSSMYGVDGNKVKK